MAATFTFTVAGTPAFGDGLLSEIVTDATTPLRIAETEFAALATIVLRDRRAAEHVALTVLLVVRREGEGVGPDRSVDDQRARRGVEVLGRSAVDA